MAEKQGRALLVVAMDVDPKFEEDFNRWYDEEHIPEQLAVPGILSARRFVSVDGSPKYLALYELDSPEAVNSPDYKARPRSEWALRVREHFKNLERRTYVESTDEG